MHILLKLAIETHFVHKISIFAVKKGLKNEVPTLSSQTVYSFLFIFACFFPGLYLAF